eukprot:g1059.t1
MLTFFRDKRGGYTNARPFVFISSRVDSGDPRCPIEHRLLDERTDCALDCDLCNSNIPAGDHVLTCATCEWDVCYKCANIDPPEDSEEEDSEEEEEVLASEDLSDEEPSNAAARKRKRKQSGNKTLCRYCDRWITNGSPLASHMRSCRQKKQRRKEQLRSLKKLRKERLRSLKKSDLGGRKVKIMRKIFALDESMMHLELARRGWSVVKTRPSKNSQAKKVHYFPPSQCGDRTPLCLADMKAKLRRFEIPFRLHPMSVSTIQDEFVSKHLRGLTSKRLGWAEMLCPICGKYINIINGWIRRHISRCSDDFYDDLSSSSSSSSVSESSDDEEVELSIKIGNVVLMRGSVVKAHRKGCGYQAASIERIHRNHKKVDVRFEGGEKRVHSLSTRYVRPAVRIETRICCSVGDAVDARFRGGENNWFRGKIAKIISENEVNIAYDDGDREYSVSTELVRVASDQSADVDGTMIAKGTVIMVRKTGSNHYRRAIVSRIRDGAADVVYEHGQENGVCINTRVRAAKCEKFLDVGSRVAVGPETMPARCRKATVVASSAIEWPPERLMKIMRTKPACTLQGCGRSHEAHRYSYADVLYDSDEKLEMRIILRHHMNGNIDRPLNNECPIELLFEPPRNRKTSRLLGMHARRRCLVRGWKRGSVSKRVSDCFDLARGREAFPVPLMEVPKSYSEERHRNKIRIPDFVYWPRMIDRRDQPLDQVAPDDLLSGHSLSQPVISSHTSDSMLSKRVAISSDTPICRTLARRGIAREFGIVAGEHIGEGEEIFRYVGEVFTAEQAHARERLYADHDDSCRCYQFALSSNVIIDATLVGNAARFCNHSCDPNCKARRIPAQVGIVFVASRPIREGEEITWNYNANAATETLSVGTRVVSRFEGKGETWYPGRVVRCSDAATYSVSFDCRSKGTCDVPRRDIRKVDSPDPIELCECVCSALSCVGTVGYHWV